MKSPTEFNSLLELMNYFDTEEKCLQYIEQIRWNGSPVCTTCFSEKIYRFKDGKRLKCADCKTEFTAKVGTIFQNSKLPMIKWFMGMYLVSCHKKGISTYDLADDLEITQKTAWFLQQRIRKLLEQDDTIILEGTVQCDESFVGGKNKNRHKDKKVRNSQGRSFIDKTPVLGMVQQQETEIVEREHKIIKGRTVKEKRITKKAFVKCKVIASTQAEAIQPVLKDNIKEGSKIYTDEWKGYNGTENHFDRSYVDHGKGQYVNGEVTSNAAENVWSQLKRSIFGIHHWVSKKHLQKYVDECTFKFNTCKFNNGHRINLMMANISGSQPYKKLIQNG